MPAYLQRTIDWRHPAIAAAYDELPLWSAAPGNLLLEHLPYAGITTVLDLGCGTGFPLLSLARRFGPSCRLIGIDPWEAALEQVARKVAAWEIPNVELILGSAVDVPLASGSVDLITSNLGLNNFEDVAGVLAECKRLLARGGRLCLATNLRGTFHEFYAVLREVTIGDAGLQHRIGTHEHHRQTVEGLETLLGTHGWEVEQVVKAEWTMTYADGTAFLNDPFIVMSFLPDWKAAVGEDGQARVFKAVEAGLNAQAREMGRLRLTVPLAYLEVKPR